jgi:hypothetical protein
MLVLLVRSCCVEVLAVDGPGLCRGVRCSIRSVSIRIFQSLRVSPLWSIALRTYWKNSLRSFPVKSEKRGALRKALKEPTFRVWRGGGELWS